ncbi:MAG: S1C family serine protease [Patescibacteria group bacterium]|jgi:S1-C subfamily serine protease
MSKFTQLIKHPSVWITVVIVGTVVLSALSGGLAGAWMAARIVPSSNPGNFRVLSATSTANGTATQTAVSSTSIKLVSVQMQDSSERVVPEPIFNRRSPVGLIYARKKAFGDSLLVNQDLQGRVVAMTSDGWFVTPPQVIAGWRVAEMLVWYDGHAYKIEKAILDKSTQAVFLKTSARDLPAIPFADLWSTRTGLAAWIESAPSELAPSSVEALRAVIENDPVSSDHAYRRLVAQGTLRKEEQGSPVWDAKGALIGIAESSADGRLSLIPGSSLSASLQSLVGSGQISHALLGVYSLDRGLIRLATTVTDMPNRGAWITGRAILKDSVAEKAGLKINDVILQVDRDIMDGSSDLSDIILQYRPGSNVTLRLWRAGKEIEVSVTLGTQITSEAIL